MNKSFSSKNPALAFISVREPAYDTQDNTQQRTQDYTQDTVPSHLVITAQTDPYGDRQIVRRKGAKLPRINMAFTNDNLEYLQVISAHLGMSQTEYVNRLLAGDRQENQKILKSAKRKSKA